MMTELRAQDAKAASVKKVRLDAAERRIIRNLVSMAEVKLCKLVPAERERACAKILAWVNNAKIQDVADLMRGMSKTGSAVNLKGMNARDTPEPPTPRDGASGAVTRGGGRLPSPRGGVGGRALAPLRARSGRPRSRRCSARRPTPPRGREWTPSRSPRTSPTSTLEASGAISHRAASSAPTGSSRRGCPASARPIACRDVRYAQYCLRAVGGDASDASEPGGADRGHAVGRLRVRAVGPGDAFARRHLVVSVHAEGSGRGRGRRGWRTRGDGSGGSRAVHPHRQGFAAVRARC